MGSVLSAWILVASRFRRKMSSSAKSNDKGLFRRGCRGNAKPGREDSGIDVLKPRSLKSSWFMNCTNRMFSVPKTGTLYECCGVVTMSI